MPLEEARAMRSLLRRELFGYPCFYLPACVAGVSSLCRGRGGPG